MRLVECVRCELLPVCPYLFEYLRVVAVLLSAFDELRLHRVNNSLLLLTHCLTQGVRFASGEVGKLAREEHHLLLIYGNAVGVLEVLLHAWDVVLNLFFAVFTGDERGDVVHRTGTIEGVHGNEVLENRRLQLAQILLHACRLKLERTDGAALLIELVCEFVVDRNCVQVDCDSVCQSDVLHCLFHYGQGGESEEVHLDESGFLNDVSVVLCCEKFVPRV